ncbi:MAG: apolipoprotein N-acyltransferase [Pseudomonadota bacterium]
MQFPVRRPFPLAALAQDALALVAGCALPLAFSPFDLWPLGILAIALLAWVTGLEQASLRRGVLRFYLFSLGMYGAGTSWIYVSIHEHGGASPLLAGLLVALFVAGFSVLPALHGWLYLRFVRPLRFGLLLGFPLAWYLREWVLTWLFTGFPWLFAGYPHLDTPLSGLVPVIGVPGVGLLVALMGAALAGLLQKPARNRLLVFALVTGTVFSVGWLAGKVQFVKPVGDPLSVSAIQGNVDQETKWTRRMVLPIIDTYLGLSESEWGRDLIVWPEASITLFRTQADELLAGLDARGRAGGTTLLLGIPDRDASGGFRNTALALGLGSGQYIKRRLVPFGEYVPLEGLLRGAIDFFDLPMSRNSPGPWTQAPLRAGGAVVSVSICYEVVYPALVRETAPGADVYVTISNDTWFGDSIGPLQHLQMARARALENGRFMVRATNNGITAIIDERGQVQGRLPQFEQGVLRGELRRFEGSTPYSQFGDWPLLLLTLLVLAGLMVDMYRRS